MPKMRLEDQQMVRLGGHLSRPKLVVIRWKKNSPEDISNETSCKKLFRGFATASARLGATTLH